MQQLLNEILKGLDNNKEYGVKYKESPTQLSLLKTENGITLHGFYNRDDAVVNKLVEDLVFDKNVGDVIHFDKSENYCTLFINDNKLLSSILNESTVCQV